MCDFCENITNEVDGDLSFKHGGLALVRDKDNNPCVVQEFVDDYGEMACLVSEPIRFCPMCGRKLREETEKYSDPFRQISKEVAEEMGGKGEFDGDYAYPIGGFVDFDEGLAYIDFSCSNCGKRYENVLLGKKVVCDCGKTIKTDVFGRRKND